MTEEFVQLKETKGNFELRGKLFGLKGERAFKEQVAKDGDLMRMMNLGVRISPTENIYLTLNGQEGIKVKGEEGRWVWFNKPGQKGEKSTTERVSAKKRNSFSKEGYRLIGFGLALHKDEETKKNEEVKNYIPFDAIKEIEDNAVDGMSVFVKGNIEFGSYEDEKTHEVKKTQKFVPNAIYLTKDEIDFESKDFEKYAEFVQPVIYRGWNRNVADDKTATFSLDVASITYRGYEEFSLPCTEKIAKLFKDKLKPYCKVNLIGNLENDQIVQIVEDDDNDDWGTKSKMGKAKNFAKTILMVSGADKDSINTEDYTSKIVENYRSAVEAEKAAKKNKSAAAETQDGGDFGKKGKIKSEDEGW